MAKHCYDTFCHTTIRARPILLRDIGAAIHNNRPKYHIVIFINLETHRKYSI